MIANQNTLHEPKLLIEIESFTKRIIDDGLKRKDLPELVRLLDAFEHIYSCNYIYTDYIGLFKFFYESYGLKQIQDGQYTYSSLLGISDWLLAHYSSQFKIHKPKVLSDIRQYKHRVKERLNKLIFFNEILFNRYSRNLVVRVDLKYQIDKQNFIDIEIFNQHVRKLCNHMANKHYCFKNLKFYAWCLEQAPLGGYHVHLYLIYDGSKSTHDCKLAKWVGRLWMDKITEGLGYYWNCHTGKGADEDGNYVAVNTVNDQVETNPNYLNGLGMIERKDLRGLEKLEAVYSYFARITDEKIDQRLRVRVKDMRAFGYSSLHVD